MDKKPLNELSFMERVEYVLGGVQGAKDAPTAYGMAMMSIEQLASYIAEVIDSYEGHAIDDLAQWYTQHQKRKVQLNEATSAGDWFKDVSAEPGAEIARLRAAGLALAANAVHRDNEWGDYSCPNCGAETGYHALEVELVHAADCPVRVFTDAPVTLVLTMTDDTTARYSDVNMADVQQVRDTLAGRYTGATHAVFYSEGVQRGIPLEEIKGVQTE